MRSWNCFDVIVINTPTQSIRQNYTSVYSFACDIVAMPKHRYCIEQPPSVAVEDGGD